MVLRVRLVPDDVDVPEILDADGFTLRKLTVRDVVADFSAIVSSADHLSGIFGHHESWPRGLTLERNLADLGWHETEFANRTSFCWAVWDPSCTEYRGCSYIYSSQKAGVDAEIYLWTTAAEHAKGFDGALYAFFRRWIAAHWPFRNPIYPGRSSPGRSIAPGPTTPGTCPKAGFVWLCHNISRPTRSIAPPTRGGGIHSLMHGRDK